MAWGRTWPNLRRGGFVYEVHDVAPGPDLYRVAVSWSPYRSLGRAWAAGVALARLHRTAEGFTRPARPQAILGRLVCGDHIA